MNEVNQRIPYFKEKLCKACNAKHSTSIETVKGLFAFDTDVFYNQNNFLFGEHEGYKYCLCESYKNGSKGHPGYWITRASIRSNQSFFPNFTLLRKHSFQWLVDFIKFILMLCLALIFTSILCSIAMGFFMEIFRGNILIVIYFLPLLLLLIPIYLTWSSSIRRISLLIQMFSQGKYGIKNRDFLNNYYIADVKDPTTVTKLFTPEVCSIILSYRPEINELKCRNKCLMFTVEREKLTTDNVFMIVENFTNYVRIFDKDDPPIDLEAKRAKELEESMSPNSEESSMLENENLSAIELEERKNKLLSEQSLIGKSSAPMLKDKSEKQGSIAFIKDLPSAIKKFNLPANLPSNTKVMSGTSEKGNEYCIYEYTKRIKGDKLERRIGSSVKLKTYNIPDFTLIDIKGETVFLRIQGIMLAFVGAILFLTAYEPMFVNKVPIKLETIICYCIFCAVLLAFIGKLLVALIKVRKAKARFGEIKFDDFSEKISFNVKNDSDAAKIKRVLSPELCRLLLDSSKEYGQINCKNSCLVFEKDGQLSKETNQKIIKTMSELGNMFDGKNV